MPQLVPKANIYIKNSAYWPSTGFHWPTLAQVSASNVVQVADALALFLPDDTVMTHWEVVDPDGAVVGSGSLNLAGLISADYDDFRDCTHITWLSDPSAERPSGNFIPGRNDALWSKGSPQAQLTTAMIALRDVLVDTGACDSEGGFITAWRRFTTSRRSNMRVAA